MKSQNGLPVPTTAATVAADIGTYTVPGTTETIRLRKGAVATVLLYVLARFNAEVERLAGNPHDEWGFVVRNVRGSSTSISNHSSGSAADANAAEHPLGTLTFSKAKIAAIHKIIADCQGVVRWGGDYSGRKDQMHFEINASEARVEALAAKIGHIQEDDMPEILMMGSKTPRPLTLGHKTALYVSDAPGFSILEGPATVVGMTVGVASNMPAGGSLQLRAYLAKYNTKTKIWDEYEDLGILDEAMPSSGNSFTNYIFSGKVPADLRLRMYAVAFGPADFAVLTTRIICPVWR